MCLALWLLVSERWLLLGLAMGALSLTRENALLLVGVVFMYVVSGVRLALTPPRAESRGGFSPNTAVRSIHTAATFLLGVALVLLPVAIRNYAVGGGFYLTTSQFGPNFYLGNNPFTDGTASSMRGGRGSAEYERQDAVELAQAATGRTLTPAEVSEYWTGRALAYIRAQPGDWARLMARKFALLWNRTEMLDTESQESYADWSWPLKIGSLFGHFGVIVPLALLGVVVTWRLRSRLWAIYALAIVYAASVLMFFIYARYRYPLVPFLLLFAAAGIGGAAEFFRSATRRQTVLTATLVAAAALLTNWPALSADHMRAITDHNLGAELQTQGRLDAAIEHYRRALAVKPDYAPAYNNLGTALLAKGRAQEAVEAYEQALKLEPDYANAEYNLGNALLQAGHPDRAVPHFRRSLELGPGSADAHNNLGIALAESGQPSEAIAQFREALRYEPDSPRIRRNLGRLLMTPASMDQAIVELSRVVALTPDDPEAHNDLGVALANVGRLAEAAETFERAVKASPGFSEAQRNLAAVRAELSKDR
jgi:tetratricopeptide (TPR) repeat protein